MPDRVLVVFLDGVGLGDDDPEVNPFVQTELPTLQGLLDGRRLVQDNGGYAGWEQSGS